MNILYQCSEYPPYKGGGIGTVTKVVAEEMVRRGHHVYVVGYYPGQAEKKEEEEVNGVKILRYNLGTRRGNTHMKLFAILNKAHLAGYFIQRELSWYENEIEQLIASYNIDVLELTDFYAFNQYSARLKFKRFAVPTIMRVHGSVSFIHHFSGDDDAMIAANDRAHFQRADWLCSVSKFAEKYVVDNYPDVKFKGERVIYNPIEGVFFKNNDASEGKIILFMGKLIKTKGAFAVVEAFNRLSQEHPDWRLRMAGNGDKEAIYSVVNPQVADKVDVLGFCNRQTIADEIDGCAFACIPTHFENFSMVPLEIMGRKRAMIFTNRTSGAEIIEDGLDGFTVNPEDIDEIFQKMKRLVEDKALRDNMAERGYKKVVSKFSVENIGDEIVDFYNEVVGLA